MNSLPVCVAARLPFWRVLLGFAVPLLALGWLLWPALDLRQVEPIDWRARHAEALAEAGPAERSADSLLPTRRGVPARLEDYVAAKVGAAKVEPSGPVWAELHEQLRAALAGKPSASAWRRAGRGETDRRFWFRPDEAPFASLNLSSRMVYVLPGGDPAGPALLVVPAGVSDSIGKAPAVVLLPNLSRWYLAVLIGGVACWLGYWTARPRPEAGTGCRACGTPLADQSRFCTVCGCSAEAQAPLPTGEDLGWAARVPVLNPFFVADMLRWLGLTALLVALIFGGISLTLDREGFRAITMLMIICGTVVFLIMLLAVGIYMLIGWRCAFVVDGEQAAIRATGLTETAGMAIAATAVVGGLIRGNLAAIGAGVGAARQGDDIAWPNVRAVTGYPRQQVVCLANSWRTVVRLYCPTPEAYRLVLAAVRGRALAAGGTLSRGPSWLVWAGLPAVVLVVAALYARLWF